MTSKVLGYCFNKNLSKSFWCRYVYIYVCLCVCIYIYVYRQSDVIPFREN